MALQNDLEYYVIDIACLKISQNSKHSVVEEFGNHSQKVGLG